MWRFDPADDSFASVQWIVDDDDDRLDALGGTSGGSATATRQLGKLGAQIGVYPVEEPRGDVAAFVCREPEPLVTPECDVHPCADERSVAVCPSPCVALFEDGHRASVPCNFRQFKYLQPEHSYISVSFVRASANEIVKRRTTKEPRTNGER